jgi:Protein of unknown function (DUF4019)
VIEKEERVMHSWPAMPSKLSLALAVRALPLLAMACGPALRAETAKSHSPSALSGPADPAALVSSAAAPEALEPIATARDEARHCARTWLALVDQGQYDASWDTAAALFQSSTSREQWDSAVLRVREPLGELSTRRFRVAEFRTHLTGAPEGKYFVVHYDSAFAKKTSAREVVTLKQAPDASWKVAGYFVE